jgi:hypothetical protein
MDCSKMWSRIVRVAVLEGVLDLRVEERFGFERHLFMHRTSNIEHRTPNIEHRTSNFQLPTFNLERPGKATTKRKQKAENRK